MSYSGRLLIIAVGGCLIALLSFALSSEEHQPQQQAYAQQASTEHRQAASGSAQLSVNREDPIKTDWSKPECDNPKGHDEADLCEQRRMSKAAEYGIALNSIQVGLSILTLLGLAATIYYTRKTAVVAERALTELERPFVYVEMPTNSFESVNEGRSTTFEKMFLICTNRGRTPAELLDFEELTPELEKGMWPEPIKINTGNRTLPPGCVSSEGAPYPLKLEFIKRWENSMTRGKLGIDTNQFILGYVRYRDIFGAQYVVGFCGIYDIVGRRFVLRGDENYNYAKRIS